MANVGVRGAVAAGIVVAASIAGPVLASTGSDQPPPCSVTYQAAPANGGSVIASTFAVGCNADPSEISSIAQQTSIRDLTATDAHRNCTQRVAATTATQSCTLAAKRLHGYLVTYRFIARGNAAVCLDDGTCSTDTPLTHPACIRTLADQSTSLSGSDVVLDCTYQQEITVG